MASEAVTSDDRHEDGRARLASLERVGPFEIVRILGAGGFAPVYLARDSFGGRVLREVALKVFLVDMLADEDRKQAIASEARALCRVEHPNVVRFYQFAESDDGAVLGLAMELVVGSSVEDQMTAQGGYVSEADTIETGIAVASALAAVHRAGLVHRDIKPSNVVATNGTYKLIDFGIATRPRSLAQRPAASSATLPVATPSSPSVRIRSAHAGAAPESVEEAFDNTISFAPAMTAQTVQHGIPHDRTVLLPARKGETVKLAPLVALPHHDRGSDGSVAPRQRTQLTGPGDADGTVAGTFGFVDPVCMATGAAAAPASDLYGLGATLYVMLTGLLPAETTAPKDSLDNLVLIGKRRPLPLRDAAPHVSKELAALVDSLLEPTREERPRSAELVANELERIRRLRAGQEVALPSEDEGPFRGLDRFEARHRSVYFGRSAEVAAALDHLRMRGVLCLVGASGSGKSSLARAAILPAIELGSLGAWPKAWDTLTVSPAQCPDLLGWLVSAAGLGVDPRSDADVILGALGKRAEREGRGLVVLLDQFEEIVTQARGDLTGIVDIVARLAERPAPGVRFVIAVRRDFFDALLAVPRLGQGLARSMLVVHPLSAAAWVDVLDQALARYGYAFDSEAMRQALAGELRAMGDAMPLVQFALAKLWAERDRQRRVLTMAALQRAGGLAGALDQHAEDVARRFVAACGPHGVEGLRSVALALTTASGTRATRSEPELAALARHPLARRALEAMVHGRLVVAEGTAYVLAHDAIVRAWSRLRTWTQEVRKLRELAEEVERQAVAWTATPNVDLLVRGRPLAEARELMERGGVVLSAHAQRFVLASRARERRAKVAGGGLVASLLVAGVLAFALWRDAHGEAVEAGRAVDRFAASAKERDVRTTRELASRLAEAERARDACQASSAAAAGGPATTP
jgi:serine/threonine protein kinase